MDFAGHVRETMRPLAPLASGVEARLPYLAGIRAVVFDLYGTLIVSAAGDIGATATGHGSGEGIVFSGRVGEVGVPSGLFETTVKRHQDSLRSRGIIFPEVDVREVWREILTSLGADPGDLATVEEFALRYECAGNPVWPMPGAGEVLGDLRQAGLRLGIASNAQFYTPPVVEGLFGKNLDELGFDPALRVFSFEVGEGKPSSRLYRILVERAKLTGLATEEIFYLGNDMKKDVLPAREAGFRTGLFAGDARSLRFGCMDATEALAVPDAVITELAQVMRLFTL